MWVGDITQLKDGHVHRQIEHTKIKIISTDEMYNVQKQTLLWKPCQLLFKICDMPALAVKKAWRSKVESIYIYVGKNRDWYQWSCGQGQYICMLGGDNHAGIIFSIVHGITLIDIITPVGCIMIL